MSHRPPPRGAPHLVIAVLCAAAAGNLVWWDQLARSHGLRSVLAHEAADLRASVGLGGAAGVAAVLAVWGGLGHRPDRPALTRAAERPPPWVRAGLLAVALVAVWTALGWCAYARVFPLPALLAANAVTFGAISGARPARPRGTDAEPDTQ